MITQELVKKLFEYRDGELYWKVKPSIRVDISKPAGYINHGYKSIGFKRKYYKTHRLIFLMFEGYFPNQIDHIDGNKLNNSIKNLRCATHSENQCNKRISKKNTSGIKGIDWHQRLKKWRVQLSVNGKKKHFGLYHDIEVAKFIAETMRNKYHGNFANHG